MTLASLLAACFLLAGAAFALVAAIGVVKFPDLYTRMHAATKAGAFGLSLMLIGLAIRWPQPRMLFMGAMIVLFFYLTAPVAAQMLSRAGYHRGAGADPRTGIDELSKSRPEPRS